MGVQEWVVTEPYLTTHASLGEGPHYHAQSQTLRFLDINNHLLHLVHLPSGPSSLRTIPTHQPIGVTADIAGVDPAKTIICGAKDGVTLFHLEDGRHEYLCRYWEGLEPREERERMVKVGRGNDGNVDAKGRFWVEAFVDPLLGEVEKEGMLMRMDRVGEGEGKWGLKMVVGGMGIPNGMSWTGMLEAGNGGGNDEDGGWMYLTNSPEQVIWRCKWDGVMGELVGEKEVWFRLEEKGVFPDGHAMDVEGNLWVACYGGGKVIRVNPEGKVTGVVRLPTRHITCPVFVGTELFVTSAEDREGEKFPESGKNGGALFRVDVGVEGVRKREVRLD